MKILHVIQSLEVRDGGPVSVVLGLASTQALVGHCVTIYTTADYIEAPENRHLPQCNGVKIYRFPVAVRPILFSPTFFCRIRDRISDFDILHIHGLYRFPVTYAALLARKINVPYIVRPQGALDPFLYRQSRYGKWALPLKRFYERFFEIPNLNHASAIHYTAQDEADRAKFLRLRAKPVIVSNGIDWESYKNLPSKGLFRRSLGLQKQMLLVLFLGRINFKKGLDLLIPAFSQVVQRLPSARLAIVGPDNEHYGLKVRKWCLEQGILDKVIFVDHLGPEEVREAYVDADVFVLPSYTENFGMTVVEALACGCPVVISDQVNIWREIQKARSGLIVRMNSHEIAQAICKILADRVDSKDMGNRGRILVKKRYNWLRIVGQMTQVYRVAIQEATVKRL